MLSQHQERGIKAFAKSPAGSDTRLAGGATCFAVLLIPRAPEAAAVTSLPEGMQITGSWAVRTG